MIGSRVGSVTGRILGSKGASSSDDEGGAGSPQFTRDATSGVAIPQSLAEWTAFNTSAGTSFMPDHSRLCQDVSGNLADAFGGQALVLSGSGSFRQSVPGWSSLSAVTPGTTTNWTVTSAELPSTVSRARLAYGYYTTTPGGQRNFCALSGGANPLRLDVSTANKLMLQQAARSAIVSTQTYMNSPFIALLVHNLDLAHGGATPLCKAYTQLEIIGDTTAVAITDANEGFGLVNSAGTMHYLFEASFSGVNAEFTDTTARAFMSALLNSAVPW